MDCPNDFFSNNTHLFLSEPFCKLLSTQGIDHITSSPCLKSNGFIECQIKTIKTSLTTAKAFGILIDHLIKTIRPTPI